MPVKAGESATHSFYPSLLSYIDHLAIPDMPPERREELDRLAGWIRTCLRAGRPADVIFICTHNSRRSQMAQVWTDVLARRFGVAGIRAWSGGTVSTAFHPLAISALERAGFRVVHPGGSNPRYRVFAGEEDSPLECWSKVYDDASQSFGDFAAVMVCSEADRGCPYVPGASGRFSLPFEDPGKADGTPEEAAVYDERCREIAAECLYLIRQFQAI
ncbi:MAG: protein-tyrosine-phosphatase [Saprospiraceae bacterium]|nr:protein-tyrosine-phosphatase [Saprospiraceae bacterium]